MRAIVVSVPAVHAELASDALWALGVVAIEERVIDADQVELWTSLGDDPSVFAEALSNRAEAWSWRIVDVDESVADTWRQHARPTWVADDFVICPAWIDASSIDADTVLLIEPGSTFGLGDHPTTVESLRAVRRHIRPGDRVLDVGCGSGVLSVAAARFGAASAHGIDISPAAVPTTLDNARANGVADAVTASTTPLADIDDRFDLVVANILAPALVELSGDLRRVLADDGVLIVSGILSARHEHVLEALAPMRVVDRDESGGWVALSLRF
ncbi:MAG: ribosomal protein methyltransferase [Actinomycetota bacterium]|jgi:ribosomal protein L11 methyltransferase